MGYIFPLVGGLVVGKQNQGGGGGGKMWRPGELLARQAEQVAKRAGKKGKKKGGEVAVKGPNRPLVLITSYGEVGFKHWSSAQAMPMGWMEVRESVLFEKGWRQPVTFVEAEALAVHLNNEIRRVENLGVAPNPNWGVGMIRSMRRQVVAVKPEGASTEGVVVESA